MHSLLLSGAELEQLLASQLGRPPTAEEITTALEQHDVDHDGQISFDEYVDWLYSDPLSEAADAGRINVATVLPYGCS